MTEKITVKIKNRLGIHARPAMMLFELIQDYQSAVLFRNENGEEAEASSIIALLMLNSSQGKSLEIEANGPDEKEVLVAIKSIIDAGFNEN